jgi:30S ribosomal protein S31
MFSLVHLSHINRNKKPKMGKGDKKSAKGKRWRHSFGNSRPRKVKKAKGATAAPKKKAAPKKAKKSA